MKMPFVLWVLFLNGPSFEGALGSLTETGKTILLEIGQSLIMTCNNSTTKAQWRKNKRKLYPTDHVKIFDNGTVYIASTDKHDVGDYDCKSSEMMEPKMIHIVELYVDENKDLPKSVNVSKHGTLSLDCLVNGHPIPKVHWFKDGKLLQKSVTSSRLQTFIENKHHVPDASLVIKPFKKTDAGNYTCQISVRSLQRNLSTIVDVIVSDPSAKVENSDGSVSALDFAVIFVALASHCFINQLALLLED